MRAVTRPLHEPVDLNDVAGDDGCLFVRDGIGIAGQGVAARVPVGEAVALLASIDCKGGDGAPGVGPVAVGSIPFTPGSDAELIVPRRIVRKGGAGLGDGITYLTDVFDDDEAGDDRGAVGVAAPRACEHGSYRIEPLVAVDKYIAAVETARDAVRAGSLTKAVIARPIVVEVDRPIDVHAVLRRLKATFGSSYRFSVDGLIGASPELLVEVEGDIVRSHPLAGTAPVTGDAGNDAAIAATLIASTKDQVEHRVVIDVVHDTLLPWCSYLDWEPEPSIIRVANVQHLGTAIEGMLSRPRPSVIELATALSPTPALGGHPRTTAIELIEEVEGFDRRSYGGCVGWVDAAGNGTWAVTIRCAELSSDRRTARLVAGGGIVADSDPAAELAETQAKFQAMLSALIRA